MTDAHPSSIVSDANIYDDLTVPYFGVVDGADAVIIGKRAKENALIYVLNSAEMFAKTYEQLRFFNPELEILHFPEWDCLPYDRISPSKDILGTRLSTLVALSNNLMKQQGRIVLTTMAALTQKLPPREILSKSQMTFKKGGFINPEKLVHYLVHNGYNKTHTVRETSEFAVRGGIIDLYPPTFENPVRLDLFDTEIETIKYFNPVDQITTEEIDNFSLSPSSEVLMNDETRAHFRKQYRELFGPIREDDLLAESVQAGRSHGGLEHWMPLFYTQTETLFDYVPKHTEVIFQDGMKSSLENRLEQAQDFYQSRVIQAEFERKSRGLVTYNPVPYKQAYLSFNDVQNALTDRNVLETKRYPFDPEIIKDKPFESEQSEIVKNFAHLRVQYQENLDDTFYADVHARIDDYFQQKNKVIIVCSSTGSRSRLIENFKKIDGVKTTEINDVADIQKLKRGTIGFLILEQDHGFTYDGLVVLTEKDILGDRLTKTVRRKKDSENFIKDISTLESNDLVVHIQHGIGRFLSLETLRVQNVSHDCLKVEYAGGDKLYVPVENIESLTRYGSESETVTLDKLGGHGWQARKAKVKKDLLIIADDLLKLAAARTLKKGEILEVQDGLYQEFVKRFPYKETEDQLRSIDAVKHDLQKGQPMDRLVCGDVGFGKTEVALRAAFIAALSGVQVALVVPTTLLARQHFFEFTKRFAGLPVRVEQLSRLVKPSEATKIKADMGRGQVDIVIGTHALLAKTIDFKRLGLLIVDEEQKFGVKQKERLKQLKDNIHILTLTATPIPRTLQLALTGVRDLSLITTPPVDRLPVKTYALPLDKMIIREALMREKYRSGQSFYVCPRITDLNDIEEMLKDIAPELKVIKAHGQMPAEILEDKITAYYEGHYDVLLATNIIESGLDIPNANTMVVHRADLFGLSQLYQIRGRIGRSKTRGYAYLTHDPKKVLNKVAVERLRILETLDTLGAGFQVASHDMDLRGAGNLLGEEQSGHIKEIGVELYQKMLEEAVENARNGIDDNESLDESLWSPQINLGINVFIPEAYVPNLNARLNLYRRASTLEHNEFESFAAEMIDRFGPVPEEVNNLLETVKIKQICKRLNIERIDIGARGGIVAFRNNECPFVTGLIDYIQKQAGTVKVRPDQRLSVIRNWATKPMRLKGIQSILNDFLALL